MKSLRNLENEFEGLPLVADDIVEFHASRILLLLLFCDKGNGIVGLTKLAKLDFFVRYPEFFERACIELEKEARTILNSVESQMIRYHYGPWDKRYYHVIAYLKSRGLIQVTQVNKSFVFVLTPIGKQVADQFAADSAFARLTEHIKQVCAVLENKKGTYLKNLVYKLFDKEVAQRPLEGVIT